MTGAAPVLTPPTGTVLGDGTTARSRAGRRWRRGRWLLAVGGVLIVAVLAAVLPQPTTSQVALAPDNPRPQGARALAQVLQDNGVHVTFVRSTTDATRAAEAGTTLLVTTDWLFSPDQAEAIAATDADLVLLAPSTLLSAAPGLQATWGGSTRPTQVVAACEDPDARAAGTISAAGTGVTAAAGATGVTLCFPDPAAADGSALYAVQDDGDRRVTVIADPGMLTNERISDSGNAALMLRALGRTDELVWFVPSTDDLSVGGGGSGEGRDLGALVPPLVRVLGVQLLVVVAALTLWRGRRLGRVVTEQLPVTVRAAEATRGRARLYRASRSHGHAAAALRAGAASRCAGRLGLPRSAGATDVIDAVARASGRTTDEVADLLYGPPPTTDAGLETLVRRLDQLESEVHRT